MPSGEHSPLCHGIHGHRWKRVRKAPCSHRIVRTSGAGASTVVLLVETSLSLPSATGEGGSAGLAPMTWASNAARRVDARLMPLRHSDRDVTGGYLTGTEDPR